MLIYVNNDAKITLDVMLTFVNWRQFMSNEVNMTMTFPVLSQGSFETTSEWLKFLYGLNSLY